jgi:DNA (cytosine-5)-methyltransferase 1
MRRAISLFSGAGGDTLGLERAGFTVVAYSENNAAAIATHQAAFPNSVLLRDPATGTTDITKIPDSVFEPYAGNVELVFGGCPCQGFSHAGKKRASDPRNELVHQMARALKIVKPRWMIFENVKGLLSRRGYDPFSETPEGQERPLRPVIQIIQEVFMRAGYMTSYRLVDVRAVGVPQLRKRLIVVGFRSSQFYPHIDWPTLPTEITDLPTIRHILTPTLVGATPLTAEPPDPRFLIQTTEAVPTGTPHPNLLRLANGIRNLSSKERAADPTAEIQTVEPDGLISFGARSSSYHGEVMDPDAASKTIICTYNLCPRLFVGLRSTVNDQRWARCLTVPELGQIQGFPADFPWQGGEKEAIKQIGNAVPPALSEHIARALLHMWGLTTPQLPPTAAAAADTDDDEE